MTDKDVLEKLLNIAVFLLQADPKHGNPLWEIFKYLKVRLEENREQLAEHLTGSRVIENEDQVLQTVNDILGERQRGDVNIISKCHIEKVIINK